MVPQVPADAVDACPVAGQRARSDLARCDGVEPERHPLLDGEPAPAGEHYAGVTLLLEPHVRSGVNVWPG
jgi:hypothetical protein